MRIPTTISAKTTFSFDREVQQDENLLLWYSGKNERHLSLDSVTHILVGQRTVNFQRQPQPEKEYQSFSLIYADGERSLDLICKDKLQVRSLCASPSRSLARCLSNGLPHSSNIIGSLESKVADTATHDDIIEKKGETSLIAEYQTSFSSEFTSQSLPFPPAESNEVLRDTLIWGEGIEEGYLGGAVDKIGSGSYARTDSLLPKLLESTENLDVKNISFGGNHSALVTRQGEVFCWGHEKGGRLGHKVNMDVFYPKIVETLNEVHIESVACGEYHTCALTHAGELYTWGVNCVGGELLDNRANRNKWWPHRISGPLDGIYVSSVACGEWHTAIVSSSGQLFTYGEGTFGVLGHGNNLSVSQPKEVESLKGLRVKSVACGSWHMVAVVDIMFDSSKPNSLSGKLFTWGDGDKGKLGHLDEGRKVLPTCVARLVHYDFLQVSCGRMLTVGLMNTGKVCTIGAAANGQLGNPQAKDNSITVVEGKLKGEFVKGISSGSYHIAVLTSRGEVFTWGKGANGRLGLGDTEDRNSPSPVEALRERQVESVICGSSFTAAICVHKSIFSTRQSSCSGCRIVFGFTRKKHNCYNCGLVFCRLCSNKKVINASLAPNNNKLHRVCNSCHNKLTKSVEISERLMHRGKDRSTNAPLLSHNISDDDETNCFTEAQGSRNQQLLHPESPLSSELPRWAGGATSHVLHSFRHPKTIVLRCPVIYLEMNQQLFLPHANILLSVDQR
ncbi:hypothetical protein C5167_030082 [Papaver somniferum]|nr:hypothetical protein C5167_030082 [Papaver somniferum]